MTCATTTTNREIHEHTGHTQEIEWPAPGYRWRVVDAQTNARQGDLLKEGGPCSVGGCCGWRRNGPGGRPVVEEAQAKRDRILVNPEAQRHLQRPPTPSAPSSRPVSNDQSTMPNRFGRPFTCPPTPAILSLLFFTYDGDGEAQLRVDDGRAGTDPRHLHVHHLIAGGRLLEAPQSEEARELGPG